METTELEKYTMENYAMVCNKKLDIYLTIAELFDNGIEDGVVFVEIGWFNSMLCSFNPYHKITGKVENINDFHFKIGDFEIIDIDKNIPNGAYYAQLWDNMKQNEKHASRPFCWESVKKQISRGEL